MKKCLLFVFVAVFLPVFMYSQQDYSFEEILVRAKKEIDTLCSATFAGRGYIDQGHIKAADYIEGRFREMGLKAIVGVKENPDYKQPFLLNINLITDATLIIDGDTLAPGRDFIVNRFSGSGNLSGKIADLGYGITAPKKPLKGKIILIRSGFPPEIANDSERLKTYQQVANVNDRIGSLMEYNPSAVVVIEKKLTAGFSREQYPIPVLEVRAEILPAKMRTAELSVKAAPTQILSQNVLGLVRGKIHSDTVVIICAHYDHLGKLGKAVFTGANDNASGTAMLLSLAEYFADPLHQPDYSLLFIAFGGEETGLTGSDFYANHQPMIPLKQTKFVLNLDLMGNGIDGIMAVGGIDFPAHFQRLVSLNDSLKAVPVVRSRKNAPNSDHYYFLQKGVPGFFIYTLGGPPHYHDVNDNPSTIELSKYAEIRALLLRFLETINH
ncbi:MAG: M28 family peptidase [Bacteroidia bacterium]|nr:M28 family peptidase [Bacteroidia bacterium]